MLRQGVACRGAPQPTLLPACAYLLSEHYQIPGFAPTRRTRCRQGPDRESHAVPTATRGILPVTTGRRPIRIGVTAVTACAVRRRTDAFAFSLDESVRLDRIAAGSTNVRRMPQCVNNVLQPVLELQLRYGNLRLLSDDVHDVRSEHHGSKGAGDGHGLRFLYGSICLYVPL